MTKDNYLKTLKKIVPYDPLKGEFKHVLDLTSISTGSLKISYQVTHKNDKIIIQYSDKTPLKAGHNQTEEKESKTQKHRILLIKPKKTWITRVYTSLLRFIYPRDTKDIGGIGKNRYYGISVYSAVDNVYTQVLHEIKVLRGKVGLRR